MAKNGNLEFFKQKVDFKLQIKIKNFKFIWSEKSVKIKWKFVEFLQKNTVFIIKMMAKKLIFYAKKQKIYKDLGEKMLLKLKFKLVIKFKPKYQ